MLRRPRTMWLAPALALLLTGCGTVRIGRILDQPGRYRNRTVRVSGRVDNSFGAILTGLYTVDDGSGRIYVISNRGVPRAGTSVSVKGTVQGGLTVGPRNFGTTLREESHKVHY